jgi:lipoprotein signal peptidase
MLIIEVKMKCYPYTILHWFRILNNGVAFSIAFYEERIKYLGALTEKSNSYYFVVVYLTTLSIAHRVLITTRVIAVVVNSSSSSSSSSSSRGSRLLSKVGTRCRA